jgi:hypothetical protein
MVSRDPQGRWELILFGLNNLFLNWRACTGWSDESLS